MAAASRTWSRFRCASIVAAFVCAIGMPGAARADDATTIHVATTPVDGGAAVYYALDLHLFEKAGLTVDVSSAYNGPAVAAAVAAGTFAFAQASLPSLAAAHERGIPFVLVLPTAIARVSDKQQVAEIVVSPTSPIRTAHDLSGKIIACNGLGSLSEMATRAWIDKNGGDSSTVKFVETPFSAMYPALAAGRVDAAFIATPSLEEATRAGARVLAAGFAGIGESIALGAWFTTRPYALAHPDIVKKFVGVLVEAGQWANAHQTESAQILAKYAKMTISPSMARAHYADKLLASDVQPVIDVTAKYHSVNQAFPAADFFAPGLGAQ